MKEYAVYVNIKRCSFLVDFCNTEAVTGLVSDFIEATSCRRIFGEMFFPRFCAKHLYHLKCRLGE